MLDSHTCAMIQLQSIVFHANSCNIVALQKQSSESTFNSLTGHLMPHQVLNKHCKCLPQEQTLQDKEALNH